MTKFREREGYIEWTDFWFWNLARHLSALLRRQRLSRSRARWRSWNVSNCWRSIDSCLRNLSKCSTVNSLQLTCATTAVCWSFSAVHRPCHSSAEARLLARSSSSAVLSDCSLVVGLVSSNSIRPWRRSSSNFAVSKGDALPKFEGQRSLVRGPTCFLF